MLGRRLLIAATAAVAGLSGCRGAGKQGPPPPTLAAPTATVANVALALPSATPDHYIVAFGYAEPDTGSAPLAVQFSFEDPFKNIDEPQCSWDFGDGSPPSVKRNPQHVYERPGRYTAHLRVIDSAGADDEDAVDIDVEGPGATAPDAAAPQD